MEQEAYDYYARSFGDWLESEGESLETLSSDSVRAWLDAPKPRGYWSPRTQRLAVCAVRAMAAEAGFKDHPSLRVKVKRGRSPRMRALAQDEYLSVMAAMDTADTRGQRDAALLALAFDTGLRSCDLRQLKLGDLHLQSRQVMLTQEKTGEDVAPIFSEGTRAKLEVWLAARQRIARGHDCVFVNLNSGKPLTRHGVRVIFRRMGEAAGVKLSPHDVRRGNAGAMHLEGCPESVGMAQGGWLDRKTYSRYTSHIVRPRDVDPYLPTRCEETMEVLIGQPQEMVERAGSSQPAPVPGAAGR